MRGLDNLGLENQLGREAGLNWSQVRALSNYLTWVTKCLKFYKTEYVLCLANIEYAQQ